MLEKRISFPNFQDEFLFQFAIIVGGDFAKPVTAKEVARHVRGRYPESWVDAVASNLCEEEFLALRYNTDTWPAEEFPQQLYSLTQAGLNVAMQHGVYNGLNLWEEIDKLEEHSGGETADTGFIPQGPVVKIDRTAPVFIDLEQRVNETWEQARTNNSINSDVAGARRVKELEAGIVLLKADQVDVGLLRRILLPALTALLKLIGDEGLKQLIKRAVELLIKFVTGL